MMNKDGLTSLLRKHGQEHVLRYWDDMATAERDALALQISEIDLELFDRLVREFVKSPRKEAPAGAIEPAEFVPVPRTARQRREAESAAEAGRKAIRAGRTAAFVVAGGQGTRLGFDGPKGAYEIGPATGRPLFRIHAEKILAASRRYAASIPWLIMTSEANHEETLAYLRRNAFFGMKEADVLVFKQRMIPASDGAGKMLLASKGRIFTSPNGHGGSLQALHESGALKELRRRGVDIISYFQVDNPLVRVIDPVFIGRHALAGAEMSSKVLSKRSPDEKVGVVARVGGRLGVIEYSDLPKELMHATNPDGSLRFDGGSIAIHVLSVDFVERLNEGGLRLPYHAAKKKIPHVGADGKTVEPSEPNGVKFETFVFDALGYAKASVTMQVERSEEFSPVKNASGEDSPETCRRDMTELYAKWIEAAGGRVDRGGDGRSLHAVEISPLYGEYPDELALRLPKGFRVSKDVVLPEKR